MNNIVLNNIKINGNKIEYDYSVQGTISKYFNLNELFTVEYDREISSIPYGIAIIPWLSNVLPLAWIFDATIYVDEIDKEFYRCIESLKEGYSNMFPSIKMKGELLPRYINEYTNPNDRIADKSIAFFSGGIDAFNTMLLHIDEKPVLTTIWGSDVKLNDVIGWNKVLDNTKMIAKTYDLDYCFIKSNFRLFISEEELENYVKPLCGDGWWHGFQCGLGLIGNAAPLMYLLDCKYAYIASSFTFKDIGSYTCSSDPTIDNKIRVSKCRVIHDGYEFNRQDKIFNILSIKEKLKRPVLLRVCWISEGGENCCSCEKCLRTIIGLLAEKQNPKDYGFYYTKKQLLSTIFKFRSGQFKFELTQWQPIQDRLRNNYSIFNVPFYLLWIYLIDLKYMPYCIPRYLWRLRCDIGTFIWYIKKYFK